MKNSLKWIFIGLLVLGAMIAFVGGIITIVIKIMKGEVYELSLAKIRISPSVIEYIGSPIQPGWFVSGSVSTNGPEGTAAIEYSISGSIADAKVYVNAIKNEGEWALEKLVVAPQSGGQRIVVVDSK